MLIYFLKGVADMHKKLVFIMALLLLCIAMMVVSLVISAETFAQISSYFSIACVLISLVGVVFIIRGHKEKNK